jgi:hypothetical protein
MSEAKRPAKGPVCKVCGLRPATVPDRDKPGAWKKAVCGECHAGRLCGDMESVMRATGHPVPPDDKPAE